MNKRILALALAVWGSLNFIACGGGGSKNPPSGLKNRVLASQEVTATTTFGSIRIVNGSNDTLPRLSAITAGTSPGLMVVSPSRNIAAAVDKSSNTVYAVNTSKETDIGHVQLAGPTTSISVPTANPIGYAAVPTAFVAGFAYLGGVQVLNFTAGALNTTIAVTNAQTVVANSTGSQLLVFSNNSDSIAVLAPANAVPPVDLSCYNASGSGVCTFVSGFDRPVFAVINGGTAYILNCGPQCGGSQASVMFFDLGTLTITKTIPVDAATMAFLHGSTLYVAGTPPANNACAGETTQAATCGRLDVINLNSGAVTAKYVITDGYHQQMSMSVNGQLYIGSTDCTNIGNAGNPSGEVRGCLSILNTTNNSVLIPPDNGDVNALQSFTSREVEYVAEGGNLRVYDTTKNILLINDFLPEGTIDIVGYVAGVNAIDFF